MLLFIILTDKEVFLRLGLAFSHSGRKNHGTKAFECYKRAARNDIPAAWSALGLCYEAGLGVEEDIAKAVEFYKKAVEMEPENVQAQFNTGRMYMKQAVALATEAEKLQGSAFTKFKMEKLDPLYQAALPYMKKAYELDTTDTQTKRLLGNIYYQLNMENELNALGL